MTTPILIIGGGGHAKVLIGAIGSMRKFGIRGILDSKLPIGTSVSGIPVLGGDELLLRPEFKNICLALGVGSMRAGTLRKGLFEKGKEVAGIFPVIQHAASTVLEAVHLGEGTQVMARAVIQVDSQIGMNCIINTATVVEHDCRIGDHSHIAPGAVLGGGVVVGTCSLIGLGATVLPGIRIGNHVTVGAGAVVIRDVPDGVTVAGVPAKQIEVQ